MIIASVTQVQCSEKLAREKRKKKKHAGYTKYREYIISKKIVMN